MSAGGLAIATGIRGYLLLQLPDLLLAGTLLVLLHWWGMFSPAWALGLFILWLAKDLAMFFCLRNAFAPSRTGPETLVGARVVAQELLAPRGHVRLHGELWRAQILRPEEEIAPGTVVVVRGVRGLTLLVEREQANDPKDAQKDPP